MLKQKPILKIEQDSKKTLKIFLSCLFMLSFFNGCMVVRFDAHFATKGTKIGSEKSNSGQPPGTFGLHMKSAASAENGAPPMEACKHGDTQIGAGAELLIGPKLGKSAEILGLFGYDRYYYFVGNDDFIKLGMQGRKKFKDETIWLGLEGSYVKDWAYLKDITDNPDVGMAGYIFNPLTQQLEYRKNRQARGWMAGLLGGTRVHLIKKLDMNVFAGAYVMQLGDFTTKKNEITKESHYNLHFKASVEIALPFFE